ncbi:MAG: redoxin domain-containing protein [Rhodospirillales bacterium]|nr:redoxin domain-containing protein [Rhodospirillales bacterium]
MQWFNVDRPISLADLRGRMVVVDFWTFCCINCLHVVPTLNRLEDAYPDELVVIGVHSPKFAAERDNANLRHAIARCGVRHPVIQDPDMVLWDEYCIRAWPTLIFIGPDGRIFGSLTGEPDADRLVAGVGAMIHAWRDQGMLSGGTLPLAPIEDPGKRLRFPGKIKPVSLTENVKHWAVADSGHNQIVLFDDAGRETRRFGSGEAGFIDGDGQSSAFNAPQGLICGDGAIFVADTGNHAIRRIDIGTGETVTLAGTGERGLALPDDPASAVETSLASVWDLELIGERLFFANAGSHQLGLLDLSNMTVRALAGSSAEDIVDGPALEAKLAQPSGLTRDSDGRTLYFADSETSSVRALTLDGPPGVETLVGSGLFEFGTDNGRFGAARLQHPLGLAWCDGRLIVADSYNGKVRVLDLDHGQVSDLGEDEFTPADEAILPTGEPAGVAADGPSRFLMTDTNNHRVIEMLPAERRVRTWVG